MTDQYIQNIRNNSEKAECYFSKKLAFTLGPVELKELSEERNVKIIDVRMRSDYEIGHIPFDNSYFNIVVNHYFLTVFSSNYEHFIP